MFFRASVVLFVLFVVASAAKSQTGRRDIFPFPVHERTLDNGLKVVVIPYDSPGIVAYFTVVRTGSRDEVEPGHSGFAHFFEHMMFRGTERYSQEAYNDILKAMGADSNAFTSDDYTNYYIIGPASQLATLMDIESDRFKNLKYSEEDFRTEALAVLGEYNKSVSSPFFPMSEKLRGLAFERHTYRHTTMGFLEDIQAMPGYYDFSLEFFDRFYRPENCIVLIVGDVDPEETFALARRYYGDWKRGHRPVEIPADPPPKKAKRSHIEWPNPTRPYLMMGFRAPAFTVETVDSAALEVMGQLLLSESAPLYRELVVEKQWVDFLSGGAPDRRDPHLFTISTRVKSEDLLPRVEAAIEEHLRRLREEPVAPGRLEEVKSHLRYGFALSLDSPGGVGFQVANALNLTGRVDTLNRYFVQLDKVTPAHIQGLANQVFRSEGRTVVTLAHGPAPPAPPAIQDEKGEAGRFEAPGEIETVTLPNPDSPLVAVRLLFRAGSVHDPKGKEGLAALTGLMIARGGTERRTYSELVEALYPLAAEIDVQTDREVTVVSGRVHRDKLAEYTSLLQEVLLTPAFSEADFQRNREQLLAYLTATLRSANDELLGLEALQQAIFQGHPYDHAPQGTVKGLQSLTLEDVKTFYAEHYTQQRLLLGVAGGYPEGYVEDLTSSLVVLPKGTEGSKELPAPPQVEGRHFTIIQKQTGSVGIHFGYPLALTRKDPDYYSLMVANSFLGEHRTFHGRLMQQLRGLRGLNYGDYSYIEYWHNPPFTTSPSPNFPRRHQYFSVWIRPVVPETAHFALRGALHEVERLIERGLTPEEFQLARDFLVNYSKLWAQTLSDRLGFQMDSRFYGMPYYIDEIERRLQALTVEEVNQAVRKHLQTENLVGVLVAANAEDLKQALMEDEPSPITYNAQVPQEVVETDKTIQNLKVRPASVTIVPVEKMFEE